MHPVCRSALPTMTQPDMVSEAAVATDDEPEIVATIVDRQPDASYPEGLSALADALVLQMFDSEVGETLRMAYTMIQQQQERQHRRTQRSVATEALREHLARLDETLDNP
jgi:hypothetical protein